MTLIHKIDTHADIVHDMAEHLRLDLGDAMMRGTLSPETYRSAVLRCTHCDDVADCANRRESAQTLDEAPEYCRNRGLFDALSRQG